MVKAAQADASDRVTDKGSRAVMTDGELAADLAREAGELLLILRQGEHGSDQVGARGDATSNDLLLRRLRAQRPADSVLSEESPDDRARLSADRVWIIDPLDGTREYSEGRPDWAVHVALWERGELVCGAVALPGLGALHHTEAPDALPRRAGRIRIAVSRSRPPTFVDDLGRHLDAELVPMGSAGVKAMAVLGGQVDAYVHAGGQYEWDSAAPVVVARASGLATCRLDGSPLLYNQADPLLPDLVIAHPEVIADVMAAVHTILTEVGAL